MRFRFLTLFPGMFDSYLGESLLKRAREKGIIEVSTHDIRDFAEDKHKTTDDTPYGGGAGMVMKVDPIFRAVESLPAHEPNANRRILLLSAKGKRLTQEDVRRLSGFDELVFICGRYEGVDERVAQHVADEELSIGDYVLTGGELPALVIADAVARLVPGVLGNTMSAETESHSETGYLEYPQYTKPEVFEGWHVPPILLSGNHAKISAWRRDHARNASPDSPQAASKEKPSSEMLP